MEFGLSEEILKKLRDIAKKYENKFYIFGSRARGDYKKSSDIDIAIIGKTNKEEKFKIKNELDELEIPYMIDIVFIQDIQSEALKNNIYNEGVEIKY